MSLEANGPTNYDGTINYFGSVPRVSIDPPVLMWRGNVTIYKMRKCGNGTVTVLFSLGKGVGGH